MTQPSTLNPQPSTRRSRRAFTLMELLVVLAITAILMVIMFVPLSRAIDMVRRAEAQTKGQDSVRTAARRISREVSEAMEVFEPRPLQVWGFNAWTFSNNVGVPTNAAVPKPYIVPNGVLAMRMPKRRYYDIPNGHYITPADLGVGPTGTGLEYDAVALNTCPRHPGAAVEMRPLQPLEPDDRIVAYFIGLKDPGYPNDGANPPNRTSDPVYNNLLLFGKSFGNQPNLLNTYVLYRVEFRLSDPLFANWNLPSGQPNPGFFYDTAQAANGRPYWENWRSRAAVSQMDAETADAVRWLEQGGEYVPKPLCTFNASPTNEVVLAPNRSPGSYLLVSGNAHLPGDLPPLEYTAEHGHWGGYQRDAAYPWPAAWTMSPAGGTQTGVRIQVVDERQASPNQVVFDTADPSRRARLVSYDTVKGRVITAFRRWNFGAGGTIFAEHYSAPVDPNTATAQLMGDNQLDPLGMPSSFGACKAVPVLSANTRIVPGSEVLMLLTNLGPGNPTGGEQMRRAGWSGLGPNLDQEYAAQNELELDEYTIDYSTGEIRLSTKDMSQWSAGSMGTGTGQKQLVVRYRFQTNRPDDVVRVSYTTNELLAMNLGIVEFTRRNREALPYEISERVVVRNLRR